jgi:hypothetical protein
MFSIRTWLIISVVVPLNVNCEEHDAHRSRDDPPASRNSTSHESTGSSKAGVKRDSGCPAAASRFLKKMRTCGLNAEGITEEILCSEIDTMAIRMVADSDSCDQFSQFLNISR